jgi:VPDSG-CTERM motif
MEDNNTFARTLPTRRGNCAGNRNRVGTLCPTRPSLHRNAGANGVQRCRDRKRAFNLTGLTFLAPGSGGIPGMNADLGRIGIGAIGGVNMDLYTGFTGPTSFGSGGGFNANAGSGNFVLLVADLERFLVPQGYVTGTALSDSMTFNSATFASLGVTPGTYVWTWGTRANQNFTLQIGSVPDAGSTLSLLGFASLGVAVLRRKLRC